jgi:predicted CXXCH cytochrome family protein
MGRSFSDVRAVPTLSKFFHQRSERHYAIDSRAGVFYMRRHQVGFRGPVENLVEREIHFAVGSGNHARSFLHRAADGSLFELPLAWYAERGGFWGMSPGYDAPNHQDFRRRVSDACLFCHNGYPQVAGGGLASGIDCQRCHGPGAAHVAAARSVRPVDAIRAAIVNPARLTSERQLEVCLQCHLETTSRPLPNMIRRYDREPFSYVPGQPLADYALHFDHAAGSGHDDKFEINSAGYRLRKSRCFAESRGKLTCTTCHDPHAIPRGEEAERHYTKACLRCHASVQAASAAGRHPAARECASCHMPRRRADDAVHVVITDHWIQRWKPARDLTAPLDELAMARRGAYTGAVEPYYPAALGEGDLYRVLAQVKDGANVAAGIAPLQRLLAATSVRWPEAWVELGDAYRRAANLEEAAGAYRRALALAPRSARAASQLADALLRLGRVEAAVAVLEPAARSEDADVLRVLGVAYGQLGRLDDSIRVLKRATQLVPERAMAWLNLGVSLEQKGDAAGAETAYRTAIAAEPDLSAGHRHLANLLAAAGDVEQAKYERLVAERLEGNR